MRGILHVGTMAGDGQRAEEQKWNNRGKRRNINRRVHSKSFTFLFGNCRRNGVWWASWGLPRPATRKRKNIVYQTLQSTNIQHDARTHRSYTAVQFWKNQQQTETKWIAHESKLLWMNLAKLCCHFLRKRLPDCFGFFGFRTSWICPSWILLSWIGTIWIQLSWTWTSLLQSTRIQTSLNLPSWIWPSRNRSSVMSLLSRA